MDILCNYQGFKKSTLILVFDAYKVKGNPGSVETYHNIHVVYTKEAETADQYIEKTVHEIGRKYRVTVATSDQLEQVIILGQGGQRMSARELLEDVIEVSHQIRETARQKRSSDKNYLFDHLDEETAARMERIRLGEGRGLRYYMAPLEEVTGYVFRNAYHAHFYPFDKYFAPFVAAKEQKGRLFNYKERNDILPENNRGIILIPQILTNNSEAFIRTARGMREYGYEEINLNLGCPSKTVVNGGRGSGFLQDREGLRKFLDKIFEQLDMKISIKTRLGRYEPEEIGPLMEIFNGYPLEELIIHPRVREDFYSGTPRLDAFSGAYEVRKAPLCYNGDIFTVEDLKRIEREFPQITAVMIGRGVLRHPGLTGQLHGKDLPEKSVWEAFAGQLRDEYVRISINEEKALFKLKEIWSYLRWSFPESNIWDRQMKVAGDLETFLYGMRNLLDTYDPEKIPEKRGIPGLHNS